MPINVEFRHCEANDFSLKPNCFNNENDGSPELKIFSHYGMLFPNGVEGKPFYFFRHSNVDSFRWCGIPEFGDGPLEPQKGGRSNEVAQKDAKIAHPYQKISDNPEAYGILADEPYCEVVYSDEGIHIKETDMMDIKAEPFPFTMFNHRFNGEGQTFFHTHCIYRGILDGKYVEGMGGFDRSCVDDIAKVSYAGFLYFSSLFSCVREDGRKEAAYCQLNGENGKGLAYYYIDGEEPFATDEVWFEGEWKHLPYAKDDPSVIFEEGVWRFADKEVHINGKWGTKGFMDTPAYEKIGQSHVFGTGYVGKENYKQRLYHTFTENCGATDVNARKAGLKVVD